MIRVGVVGEDPNDTSSIISLLSKKYTHIQFKKLAKGVTGCQLDSQKLVKTLKIDCGKKNLNSIIYIRDLDGFDSEKVKVRKIEAWFNNLNDQLGKKGVLLTNIWELEALIFADIVCFNNLYKINYQYKGDPAKVKDPKAELKRLTTNSIRKFHESHCPDIFDKLNFDVVYKNCEYFRHFIGQFNAAI